MKKLFIAMAFVLLFTACGEESNADAEHNDTVTNAVQNAEGVENNPYNLPGSDTGAIHENTDQPGVLDKDARDTNQRN